MLDVFSQNMAHCTAVIWSSFKLALVAMLAQLAIVANYANFFVCLCSFLYVLDMFWGNNDCLEL